MKAAAFKVRGAQVVVGDALNPQSVIQAAQGTDHIISLIAVRRNRPQSYLAVNVDGPRMLGEAAKAAGVRSVVFVSAIGSKLDPHFKYYTSRWMGEQELAKTGVAGLILRFSFILAEEGGILNDFERAIVGPFAIIPGSGQAKMQPILREDAARCIVEAIARPELLGHIIELGGPEVVTYENIFDWFLKARNIKKAKLKLPVPLLVPAAVAMETLSTNPPITPDEVNMIQVDNLAAGIDSVSSQCGWRPSAPSSWAAGIRPEAGPGRNFQPWPPRTGGVAWRDLRRGRRRGARRAGRGRVREGRPGGGGAPVQRPPHAGASAGSRWRADPRSCGAARAGRLARGRAGPVSQPAGSCRLGVRAAATNQIELRPASAHSTSCSGRPPLTPIAPTTLPSRRIRTDPKPGTIGTQTRRSATPKNPGR